MRTVTIFAVALSVSGCSRHRKWQDDPVKPQVAQLDTCPHRNHGAPACGPFSVGLDLPAGAIRAGSEAENVNRATPMTDRFRFWTDEGIDKRDVTLSVDLEVFEDSLQYNIVSSIDDETKTIVRTETLSDGTLVTLRPKKNDEPGYKVRALRSIGGQRVLCAAWTSEPLDTVGKLEAICRSMRAAKQ